MDLSVGQIIQLNGEDHMIVAITTYGNSAPPSINTMPVSEYLMKSKIVNIGGMDTTISDYLAELTNKYLAEK